MNKTDYNRYIKRAEQIGFDNKAHYFSKSTVFLSEPKLHSSVIAEYLKKASEGGYKSVIFTWFHGMSAVKFEIIL